MNAQDVESYFGPGIEVAPIAPPETPARGWQYWPFINQNFIPRPDAEYTAQQLRALALYPLARMCIENAKDVICNLPRQIRLKKKDGEKNADVDKRAKGDANLKFLNKFFDSPDGEKPWSDWLRPFLDDQYVIDAASFLVERSRGKQPAIIRYVDGAFVNCQVDVRGIVRSYQLLWSGSPGTVGGIPFVDLDKSQLVYSPRNIVPRNTVSSFLYGMSQTEQGAIDIQIGSARLGFILSYYTDGEIPDGIHIVPPNVQTDQLRATQKTMEAELTGLANLYRRHHILMHQGFVDRTLPGGTTGDQIIFPKAELLQDPEQENHIRKIAFLYGVPSNRLLKQLNRSTAQSDQESAEEEGFLPVAMWVKNRIDYMIANIFGFGWDTYEFSFDTQKELDPLKRAQADASDVKEGIITRDEARTSRGLDPHGGLSAELCVDTLNGPVPVDVAKRVDVAGQMQQATQPPEQQDSQPSPKKKVLKRAAPRLDPRHETTDTRAATSRLETALVRVFMRQKERATQEAKRLLKADDAKEKADEIYKYIQDEFQSLTPENRAALEQAAKAGIAAAILQVKITDTGLLSSINELAADYATKRAAEMVGMKVTTEGELVPNPSAKWAITDTTRDRLREIITNAFEEKTPFDELIGKINDADIFSEARATMIAKTEVATAQVKSNFEVWKKSGLVKKTKWIVDGDPCEVCLMNENVVRPIGEPFPSGDIAPLAHPRCMCYLVATEFVE